MTKNTEWETNFDDYYHMGCAQILSGKITKSEFKRNIKSFIHTQIQQAEQRTRNEIITELSDEGKITKIIQEYFDEPNSCGGFESRTCDWNSPRQFEHLNTPEDVEKYLVEHESPRLAKAISNYIRQGLVEGGE